MLTLNDNKSNVQRTKQIANSLGLGFYTIPVGLHS